MTRATSIEHVHGRRVFDSRGRPTVEAEVRLQGGAVGRAIAPAGASKGSAEAVDRRDGGSVMGGHDVRGAVAAVGERIAPALRGLNGRDQVAVDEALIALDGTANRSGLGANAMIAVSMAVAWAAAEAAGQPLWRYLLGDRQGPVTLPLPEIQIFGGGAHAARRVDIQDFMIVCP
ncbi:MAG: phosphopyruvate hydratase, partial [Geminicoccaceae bacterium]|nr:phosphopyruvate hydratase [Geminicoccaceae bacterium]